MDFKSAIASNRSDVKVNVMFQTLAILNHFNAFISSIG